MHPSGGVPLVKMCRRGRCGMHLSGWSSDQRGAGVVCGMHTVPAPPQRVCRMHTLAVERSQCSCTLRGFAGGTHCPGEDGGAEDITT